MAEESVRIPVLGAGHVNGVGQMYPSDRPQPGKTHGVKQSSAYVWGLGNMYAQSKKPTDQVIIKTPAQEPGNEASGLLYQPEDYYTNPREHVCYYANLREHVGYYANLREHVCYYANLREHVDSDLDFFRSSDCIHDRTMKQSSYNFPLVSFI